jgi:hypothetical protein
MTVSDSGTPMVIGGDSMGFGGGGFIWAFLIFALLMGNGGFGFGGNGMWWLIVLLLFMNNGWGFGNGFGFGGGMMPFMMGNQQGQDVQRGFDQSAIMGGLNDIAGALSNGFANAEISRCNAQANVLQTLNANQAATLQSMNALSMGLQNCCCENRAGLADLKYTVATENCADRTALNEGLVNLMMNNNANTQRMVDTTVTAVGNVMDKICQLELDAKNDRIATLQAQLNDANRRAESKDEIAQIMAGQRALANEVEQYVLPTPRPAWIVQNPNCCYQNSGCGCGCGA